MLKKFKSIITLLVLSVCVMGFIGCSQTSKKDVKNTTNTIATTNKKTSTEDKDLIKEINPTLLGFAETVYNTDYTKDTLETIQKRGDYCTKSAKENSAIEMYQSGLDNIKNGEYITSVKDINVKIIKQENDKIYVETTVNEKINHWKDSDGKVWTNFDYTAEFTATLEKENSVWKISEYEITK